MGAGCYFFPVTTTIRKNGISRSPADGKSTRPGSSIWVLTLSRILSRIRDIFVHVRPNMRFGSTQCINPYYFPTVLDVTISVISSNMYIVSAPPPNVENYFSGVANWCNIRVYTDSDGKIYSGVLDHLPHARLSTPRSSSLRLSPSLFS